MDPMQEFFHLDRISNLKRLQYESEAINRQMAHFTELCHQQKLRKQAEEHADTVNVLHQKIKDLNNNLEMLTYVLNCIKEISPSIPIDAMKERYIIRTYHLSLIKAYRAAEIKGRAALQTALAYASALGAESTYSLQQIEKKMLDAIASIDKLDFEKTWWCWKYPREPRIDPMDNSNVASEVLDLYKETRNLVKETNIAIAKESAATSLAKEYGAFLKMGSDSIQADINLVVKSLN